MGLYHRQQSPVRRRKKKTMKSLLSEAEKKEITVKNYAACVLNLMKKKNMSIEDIFETFEMPAELQEAVLEEVRRLS